MCEGGMIVSTDTLRFLSSEGDAWARSVLCLMEDLWIMILGVRVKNGEVLAFVVAE